MRIAYLTCELKSRDLDSRLLIAAHLLKRGVTVAVGQFWSLNHNTDTAPTGVFLLKTANKMQATTAEKCKKSGHSVAICDEEMIALTNPYIERMITDEAALRSCDVFLAQDKKHSDLVKSIYPDCAIKVVGNARVDLLLSHSHIYASEAAAIKARGRLVLINTNFTLSNSVWGDKVLEISAFAGGVDLQTEEGRGHVRDWMDTERANFEATVALVGWMTKHLTGWRIVVRPHPAENANAWQSIPGIEVVVGTNPVPWIMAADLVVHANSTTGVEAALLKVPCLNLCPIPRSEFSKSYITRKINTTVTSVSAAAQAIKAYLKRGQGLLTKPPAQPPFPAGAAEKIADAITLLAPETVEREQWGERGERPEATKAKFSLSADELVKRLTLLFPALEAKCSEVVELDDSLFLLKP